MKHLYFLKPDAYYYVRSWQAYSRVGDLDPKGIYTHAYSVAQALRQIAIRIAHDLHTTQYDIDLYSKDIQIIEE